MTLRYILPILLLLLIAFYFGGRWFVRTSPKQVIAKGRKAALWGLGALLILLAVTGRASWIFAVIGGALPFAQRAMTAMRAWRFLRGAVGTGAGQASASGAQQSTVRTRYIVMTLNHASGELDGEIIEGRSKGRRLSALDLPELLALYRECSDDPQSLQVLAAYLDRLHPEWRTRANEGQGPVLPNGAMSREEAYEILGLEPGADPDTVRAAHRRLMQRLHPDRGGSDWLASRINLAKDLLIGE